MRPRRVAAIGLMGFVVSAAGVGPPAGLATAAVTTRTVTLAPVADAYVEEGSAEAKGSTDPTSCRVNVASPVRQCLLRFQISGLAAGDTVTAAEVTAVVKSGSTAGQRVGLAPTSLGAGSWQESTVTYVTRPTVDAGAAASTTPLQTLGAFQSTVAWGLRPGLVSGNGAIEFAVHADPSATLPVNLYSAEHGLTGTDPSPRLVLHVTNRCGEPVSRADYVPTCGAWFGAAPKPTLTTWQVTWPQPDRLLDIVHYYHDLGDYDTEAENFGTDATSAADQILFVNVKPKDGATLFRWQDLADGGYDDKIIAMSHNVIDWGLAHPGRRAMVTFHHEFETDTPQFGPPGATALQGMDAYRAATRRFWQVLATPDTRAASRGKVATDSVLRVWTVAGYWRNVHLWQRAYPGDGVVDWIAYDPYRRLCEDAAGNGRDLAGTFGPAVGAAIGHDLSATFPVYAWATGGGVVRSGVTYRKTDLGVGSDSLTKPIMISETGAGLDVGRTDATAYVQYFADLRDRLRDYRQIKAVVYWNGAQSANGEACHAPDLPIPAGSTTRPGLAMFQSWAKAPYFNQPRP